MACRILDWTPDHHSKITKSQPLDLQGIPSLVMFKPRKFANLITGSAFGIVRAALAIWAPAGQTQLTELWPLSHTWALPSESGKKPRRHHQNPCSWSSLIRKKLRSASKSTWPKSDVGLSAHPCVQSSSSAVEPQPSWLFTSKTWTILDFLFSILTFSSTESISIFCAFCSWTFTQDLTLSVSLHLAPLPSAPALSPLTCTAQSPATGAPTSSLSPAVFSLCNRQRDPAKM